MVNDFHPCSLLLSSAKILAARVIHSRQEKGLFSWKKNWPKIKDRHVLVWKVLIFRDPQWNFRLITYNKSCTQGYSRLSNALPFNKNECPRITQHLRKLSTWWGGWCKRNFPIGKKKSKRKGIPEEISTSQRGERNFQDDRKQRLNKGDS